MPKVSVVMPVFNGEEFLREALDSIIAQTFTDWEFIIINEFGSSAAATEILQEYETKDSRIQVISNRSSLGIAKSLNTGIRAASGEYIARMDADDLAYPVRFQKQVAFLNENPEVGICGTWQKHCGRRGTWIHRPPAGEQELAASLLFSCEMCHSTVMMRREILERNRLFYSETYAAEDFELWGRAIAVAVLANLPEVLGEYRYGDTLTTGKREALEKEHGALCVAAIERMLALRLPETDIPLLNAWRNPFRMEASRSKRNADLMRYAQILELIWEANAECKTFEPQALLRVLRRRWVWAKWDIETQGNNTLTIQDVFQPVAAPCAHWVGQRVKKRLR